MKTIMIYVLQAMLPARQEAASDSELFGGARLCRAAGLRSAARQSLAPPTGALHLVLLLSALVLLQSSPAFADITPTSCARAADYWLRSRGTGMLVMQNGNIVFERYANGGMQNGRWPIFSGTKSFWGIAALCAMRDGFFRLDEHVADTITEWKADPVRSQITIRELLSLTSGLEEAPLLHRTSLPDRNALALRCAVVAAPGTRFIYGPSHLQVFCELLRRKLVGRSTPVSYIQQNVLAPLGLGGMEFKRDGRGNPLLASGFELTAREWARLGELVLGHGSYNGQQVIPAAILQQAFVGSGPNPSYGLTFWLNRGGHEIDIEKELALKWDRARWGNVAVARAAPNDMVVGLGSNYQRLFIIPSMNAIIVRQGHDARFSDGYFLKLVLGR